jgi:16S rRNA processing protein RimM
MTKEECFYIGYVAKRIGNHGEVSFFLDVDNPTRYSDLQSVFLELNETLIPFFIKKIQVKGNNAAVSIEGVDAIEKTDELIKAGLYLPLRFLPPLNGKHFYFHEMPGYTVIDKIHGEIGVIDQILDLPHQAVFQIKHGEKEILIPAQEQFIVSINRDKKILEVDAPEGLIDLYLAGDA